MDSATEDLLRSSLGHLLEGGAGPLAPRLEELGWDEVVADDRPGALRLLFEARGTTLSAVDALGPVLAATLAAGVGRTELASAVIVLPLSLHPDKCSSVLRGDTLQVKGVVLSPPQPGDTLVVPVSQSGAIRLAAVEYDGVGVLDRLGGMEDGALTRLSTTADPAWIDPDIWPALVTTARWALAIEMVAVARRVVESAVEYTSQRKQYGRAIGTFQALQHRLAGAFASVCGAGDVALEASKSGREWDAMVAKALAGRAAENACTQAQQCYGAIGFTWEHPFHRDLRRVYSLDRMFGDWRSLEAEIGTALTRSTAVPKVGGL